MTTVSKNVWFGCLVVRIRGFAPLFCKKRMRRRWPLFLGGLMIVIASTITQELFVLVQSSLGLCMLRVFLRALPAVILILVGHLIHVFFLQVSASRRMCIAQVRDTTIALTSLWHNNTQKSDTQFWPLCGKVHMARSCLARVSSRCRPRYLFRDGVPSAQTAHWFQTVCYNFLRLESAKW